MRSNVGCFQDAMSPMILEDPSSMAYRKCRRPSSSGMSPEPVLTRMFILPPLEVVTHRHFVRSGCLSFPACLGSGNIGCGNVRWTEGVAFFRRGSRAQDRRLCSATGCEQRPKAEAGQAQRWGRKYSEAACRGDGGQPRFGGPRRRRRHGCMRESTSRRASAHLPCTLERRGCPLCRSAMRSLRAWRLNQRFNESRGRKAYG